MALPPPAVARQPLHRRAIQVEAFKRADGLFDLEARLTDTKHHAIDIAAGGRREAGEPIHDMMLRVTIDRDFTIVAVDTGPISVPIQGVCDAVGPRYERLIGLNLLRGFRKAVQARLGRTEGCTHMTELTAVLPTAALQSIAHLVRSIDASDPSEPPFFIGHCHAYDRSGEVVRRHYPQWFVQAD
jgi:hypothetical protein